ncbi:MAG TPA: BlaI/MecI/CopY family transcriptional regulator [Candidatus Nanoarchaeia archaeon]|nr:BlaI/MecI/CopY family transcriptional regulator [Candidatus Nanoarchaeia archaeon]
MKEKIADFESLLSPLEGDVLRVLWPDKSMRVREIHTRLKEKRKVALSSVAVICDRLHDKGIVARNIETARGGVRYLYYPTQDKNSFEKSVVEKTVNKLIETFGPTAVSYFNERFKKR